MSVRCGETAVRQPTKAERLLRYKSLCVVGLRKEFPEEMSKGAWHRDALDSWHRDAGLAEVHGTGMLDSDSRLSGNDWCGCCTD